jgi:hypothetical protein
VASNHEATLTVKAQVADATRKMHDLERQVSKLEKGLKSKAKAADAAKKSVDGIGDRVLSVGSKVANMATGFQSAAEMLASFGARAAAFGTVSANFSGNIDSLRKATKGLVDDQTLMVASNKAQVLGVVQTQQEFESLAHAAQKLGAAMGVDAATAIADVTDALGKGSAEVLNNIGVNLKMEDAQRRYAAQLGITADKLTDTQKAEAFRVIGMQEVIAKADQMVDSEAKMGEGLQRLNVLYTNALDNLGMLDKHIMDLAREFALAAESGSVFGKILDTITFGAGSSARELERLLADLDVANARLQNAEDRAQEVADEIRDNSRKFDERVEMIWIERYAKGERIPVVMEEINELTVKHAGTINMVNAAMSMLDREVQKDVYGKIKKGLDKLPKDKTAKKRTGGVGRMGPMDRGPADVSDLITPSGAVSETQSMLDARVVAAERMLQLETAQQVSLERQWQIQQQIFAAEMEALDNRLMGESDPNAAMALQNEREQMLHDQQVARAEHQIALAQRRAQVEQQAAERIAAAHRKTAQAINDASNLTGGAIQGVSDIAQTAAEQHGQSAESAEKKRRAWGAAILAVDAIFYGAKAAAAFAALNPIEGAGFLSAAIISGTKAAQMGASVSSVGGGGGRGSSSPGFGDRGPIQRERGANAPGSKVPGSAGSPSSLPNAGKQTAGTVVYVNTQVLGAIDETSAVKIQRGLEDAMKSGRVRMGRPS